MNSSILDIEKYLTYVYKSFQFLLFLFVRGVEIKQLRLKKMYSISHQRKPQQQQTKFSDVVVAAKKSYR